MADLEDIYNDKYNWVYFENNEGIIGVYRRCFCGRFLKKGRLYTNMVGEIRLSGWVCKKCGEIEPYFDRDIE